MTHISPGRIEREIQSRFNPIRQLTPERLSRALETFHLGYLRDAGLLWDAMKRRDLHLQCVASKREKSVARHPWQILTLDDSPEALSHKQALEYFYNNLTCTSVLEQDEVGGTQTLIRMAMRAVGFKYAPFEIIWKPQDPSIQVKSTEIQVEGEKKPVFLNSLLSAELRYVPLWFFEARKGKLRFLQQEFATDGVDLKPEEWMVVVGDGIMEATSVAYTFKHLGLKDLLLFCEKFGIPGVLGKTSAKPGTPEYEAFCEAVKSFCADWAAVVSGDGTIELIKADAQGGGPHLPLVNYCDQRMAAAWRGGDLATVSQGDDSVGASLQGDESTMLEIDDAQMVSESFNIQLDRVVIKYLFGESVKPKAYFKIVVPEKKNITQELAIDNFLLRGGAPVSIQNRLEFYGRPMPKKGELLMRAAQTQLAQPGAEEADLANENGQDFRTAALQMVVKAIAEDMQPVHQRLKRILEISDPALMRTRMLALLDELPQLLKDINADPASAKQFEDAFSASLLNGAAIAALERAQLLPRFMTADELRRIGRQS